MLLTRLSKFFISVLYALGVPFPSKLLLLCLPLDCGESDRITKAASAEQGQQHSLIYLGQVEPPKRLHRNRVTTYKKRKMEIVTTAAIEIVKTIGKLVAKPIGAQCGYLIFYEGNISNVKNALKALENRKQELQQRVEFEKNNGRDIFPRVKEWLHGVEEIQAALRSFNEDEANKKCLGGLCPNLKTRYSLGKRAKENMTKLQLLEEQTFGIISTPARPPEYGEFFSSKGIKSFESRNEIIRDVIKMLKDEGCDRVSICGMGGVGKTTLVKEVIKIVEAEKLFQRIAMVAVSQTPDYCKIQVEIARRLGLELSDKDPEQSRAEKLLKRIKTSAGDGGVLIVLDDVWEELNFEPIGLPSNGDHKACKIIFTSRNEGTCSRMGSKKTFVVNTLSREDSWALFQEIIAGDVVNNSDIRPIAEDVANECGGLPIAIVTVGKALQGKTDKYIWENALDDLTKSSGSFSEVEKCIALSYNLLDKDKAHHFLFLCCSFPEDFDIPIEDVVREGWGLGWFRDQDALWKARNKAHALVNDLKKCYLLLDSDQEECVKMHDVVRDVITSIASKKEDDFEIQCGAQKGTWNISCSAVSFVIDELKECPDVEEYPKLVLLRVESKEGKSIPTNFFRGMSKLQALCLQNSCIPSASPLFPPSKNLRTLRLERCQVGDASIIGKELPTLEILSLAYSDITEVPNEIGELGSLRLLDLTGCDGLCKFSSNVLARLSQLEELYLRMQNFPWMQNDDFLIELKDISPRLKVVEIKVRKVEPFLKDLIFENVRRFWVFVASHTHYAEHGCMEPNILHLRAVDYNSVKCSMTLKHLVKRCEILIAENVQNLKNIICNLEEGAGLSCLKDLQISQCSNLEYLIDSSEVHKSMIGCTNLVKLELRDLPELKCFNKANNLNESHQSRPHQFPRLETILLEKCTSLRMVFDMQEFQNLRALRISGCNSLTHIFNCEIGETTLQIEKLEIESCELMTNLVGGSIERKEEEYNGKANAKTIIFKRLHSLSLIELPKLESICADRNDVECPLLRKLDIDHCPMLKTPLSQNQVLVAIQDNVGVTSNSNTHQSRSFNRLLGCTPLLSKFTQQATTNKTSTKATTASREQISSTSKTKSSIGISHAPILEDICVRNCDGLDLLFCLKQNCKPSCLKTIRIEGCDKLEFIMAKREKETEMMNYFAELQAIDLRNLPNFERFFYFANDTSLDEHDDMGACGDQRQTRLDPLIDVFLFPKLRSLHIEGCNKVRIFFSPSSLTSLVCLEEISLQDCKNVEEIVSQEEIETTANKITCPKLQHILLQDLSNIKAFSQGCHDFVFPSLQNVKIKGCSNMKMFSRGSLNTPQLKNFEMEIGPHEKDATIKGFKIFVASQGSKKLTALQTLKIDIKEFHELLMIVPFKEIHMLQDVGELIVAKCNSLVEVFESAGEVDVKEGDTITHELQSMELKELPQLRHIWGPNITGLVSFNKLESISIESCHSLKSLMSHSMAKSLVQLKVLRIVNCKMMQGIVTKEHENRDRGIKVETIFPKLKMLDLTNLPELECFCMGDNNYDIIWDGEDRNIEKMNVTECPKLVSLAPFIEIHMLQRVMELHIEHCDSLAEVFALGGGMDAKKGNVTAAHYEMEIMESRDLPRLRVDSFNKLASIRIIKCDSLKSLLSHSMARSLVQLKEITVEKCEIMEEIVTMGEENRDDGGSKVEILFPKLETLELYGLPKLECVCSRYYGYEIPLCDGEEEDKEINNKQNCAHGYEFPQLQIFWLEDVPSLKCFCGGAYDYELMLSSSDGVEDHTQAATFPNGNVTVSTPKLSEIFAAGRHLRTMGDINLAIHYLQNSEKHKVQVELQKLETFRCIEQHQYQHLLAYITMVTRLELESCHRLLSCVPSNMMRSFQHLERLRVQQCGCLEEIFEPNDYEGMELRRLELHSLPKLKHIWGNPGSMSGFQNLWGLKISGCHDLKFVFPDASVARSLPNLEYLEVRECNKMEEIIPDNNTNDSIPKGAKIRFPSLGGILLSTLPKLNCFCPSPFHFELPSCGYITVEGCPEMKTFCSGTLYTPRLREFSVEGTELDIEEEDVNEAMQEIQRH